jgi:hypothetical protein
MTKGYPDWGYVQKRPDYYFTTGNLPAVLPYEFVSIFVPVGLIYEVNYAMIYYWSGVSDLIQMIYYSNADGATYTIHKILTPLINQTYNLPLPIYVSENDGFGFRVRVTTAPLDYEVRLLYNEQNV